MCLFHVAASFDLAAAAHAPAHDEFNGAPKVSPIHRGVMTTASDRQRPWANFAATRFAAGDIDDLRQASLSAFARIRGLLEQRGGQLSPGLRGDGQHPQADLPGLCFRVTGPR